MDSTKRSFWNLNNRELQNEMRAYGNGWSTSKHNFLASYLFLTMTMLPAGNKVEVEEFHLSLVSPAGNVGGALYHKL
jgi:uncharacterized membrane protein